MSSLAFIIYYESGIITLQSKYAIVPRTICCIDKCISAWLNINNDYTYRTKTLRFKMCMNIRVSFFSVVSVL